jgi:hypothetical protein
LLAPRDCFSHWFILNKKKCSPTLVHLELTEQALTGIDDLGSLPRLRYLGLDGNSIANLGDGLMGAWWTQTRFPFTSGTGLIPV